MELYHPLISLEKMLTSGSAFSSLPPGLIPNDHYFHRGNSQSIPFSEFFDLFLHAISITHFTSVTPPTLGCPTGHLQGLPTPLNHLSKYPSLIKIPCLPTSFAQRTLTATFTLSRSLTHWLLPSPQSRSNLFSLLYTYSGLIP